MIQRFNRTLREAALDPPWDSLEDVRTITNA